MFGKCFLIVLILLGVSLHGKSQNNFSKKYIEYGETNSIEYYRSEINRGISLIDADINESRNILQNVFRKTTHLYNYTKNIEYKSVSLDAAYYIGASYSRQMQYSRVFFIYNMILEEAKRHNLPQIIKKAYNGIGQEYFVTKNYPQARFYYLKYLEVSHRLNDTLGIAYATNYLGVLLVIENNFEEGLSFFEKSLEYMLAINSSNGIIVSYGNIALTYFKMQEYDLAEKYFLLALEQAIEKNAVWHVCQSYVHLAQTHNAKGDYHEAIHYSRKGIETAERLGRTEVLASGHEELAISYENLGLLDSAILSYKKFQFFNDSLMSINQDFQFQEIKAKEKYKTDIDRLQIHQIYQEESEKKSQIQKLYLMIILLLMLASMIFMFRSLKNKLKIGKLLVEHNNSLSEVNFSLQQSEKNLQEANSIKDKFIAILAHDILTPASSIKTTSNVIYENFHDIDKGTLYKCLFEIKEEANRHHELIQNILQWVILRKGNPGYSPKEIDMGIAVGKVVLLIEHEAKKKNIIIINKVLENTHVFADFSMVSAVLRNLISNAIKFSPDGSEIRIESTEIESGYVFSVIDQGIGIAENDVDKLMTTACDFSKIGKHSSKGMGLGLMLCKELIIINGGRMFVESIPEKGSRFSFSLNYKVI